MRLILGLFIIVSIASCSRGFLEHADTYYNHSEAYEMCQKLKTGFLIVQVPCEGRKHKLLKAQLENEKNPKKRKRLESTYNKELLELSQAQRSLVNGFPAYYDFSKVAFIPDTLISEFKKGRKTNIFFDQNLSLITDQSIDTSSYVMYVRNLRDFDHLYIYTSNNILPPDPFPYSSTVSTNDINILAKSEKTTLIENHQIYMAIVTLNRKLKKLFFTLPPSPKSAY